MTVGIPTVVPYPNAMHVRVDLMPFQSAVEVETEPPFTWIRLTRLDATTTETSRAPASPLCRP